MALTLTADLGVPTTLDPATRLTVTGTVPDSIVAGYQFRLESEVLELRYFGETTETVLGGAATQTVDDRNVWYAARGVAGTTIATHALGTAVKGITDALVAGTTETLPDPVVSGASEADLTEHEELTTDVHGITDTEALVRTVVSATDPGGVGFWIRTGTLAALPIDGRTVYGLFSRDDALDPWLPVGIADWDEAGNLRGYIGFPEPGANAGYDFVIFDENGVLQSQIASGGANWIIRGDASADAYARIEYDGGANLNILFQADVSGAGGQINVSAFGINITTGTGSPGILLGADGNVYINGLPTADPLADNAFWLNSGVLTKSTGTP